MTQIAKVYDEDLDTFYDDPSATCFIQLTLTPSNKGVLDLFKFFISDSNTVYQKGSLTLSGSDDGVSFTTIEVISESNIHQGWNIVAYDGVTRPSYNIYKLEGSETNSCRIGEVVFKGIQAIDSTASTYDCTPKVWLNGVSETVDPTLKVTYGATPTLTSVEPRYIGLTGGDTVVLEGTFINNSCTATVFIDGIQATVDSFSSTSITITTPPKPIVDPGAPSQTSSCKKSSSLKINIDCLGDVANMEETIMYVSKWSDRETWMFVCPP